MTTLVKHLGRMTVCLVMLATIQVAHASLTIFDAIITKVNGETIVVRVSHSPYSSITVLSSMMTHHSGVWKPITMKLDQFETYFIDDIPVPKEQIKPLLVPGASISTFENRDCWYFLRVSSAGAGSDTGIVTAVNDKTISLTRKQSTTGDWNNTFERNPEHGKIEEDGLIHLDDKHFPPRVTDIPLDDNAVVRIGFEPKVRPLQGAKVVGKRAIVQQARDKMRVELLPEGFGDWKQIEQHTAGWGRGDKAHMAGSFYGVLISDKVRNGQINTANIGSEEKIKSARILDFNVLNGGSVEPGPDSRGIYRKGETILVDNLMMNKSEIFAEWVRPGRLMAAHTRRSRWTPDMFAMNSDEPMGGA